MADMIVLGGSFTRIHFLVRSENRGGGEDNWPARGRSESVCITGVWVSNTEFPKLILKVEKIS